MVEKNTLTKTLIETLGIDSNDARRIVGVVLDEMDSSNEESVTESTTGVANQETRIHDPIDRSATAMFSSLHESSETIDFGAPDPSDAEDTTVRAPVDSPAHGLLGRYEDMGILGVGGMGEVRLVRDDRLKRTLAMKIIHENLMRSPRTVSRFVEEAQVGAQLQHPNIVPIYEIGILPDGRHYFTMQQIRGSEFCMSIWEVHRASDEERWKAAPDGSTFRDLIRTFQQVCVTLAYAHQQGVIHRDLKPENIMIGGFGEVLVVDWGLAKVLGRTQESDEEEDIIQTDRSNTGSMQTRMGSVAGTPCYMPPEQAKGDTERIGKHSDVYSLGAILYEILSGEPPYSGHSAQDVIEQVIAGPPPILIPVDPVQANDEGVVGTKQRVPISLPRKTKIPIPLARICEKAMQRDISLRTEDASVLSAEIRAWLEGDEKREKGLKELESAQQFAERARTQEQLAERLWKEAGDLLERKGIDNENAWRRWAESRSTWSESKNLWRRHTRTLLGALVHAPDLEEAHLALAEIRSREITQAAAMGDRETREALRQQFDGHLKMLSESKQAQMEDHLAQELNDGISGLRFRRGALVGRHRLRQEIHEGLQQGKLLITLLGTAGVGKTRVALELANELRNEYQRTVFCDLTEATDTMGVMRRLAAELNIRLRDRNPAEHLSEFLGYETTLLVLDNLEQVREHVVPLIREWTSRNPSLRIISTSRLRLGMTEETVVSVRPMGTLESVDLFLRRARTADGRFELNQHNRAQVCTLVRQLDGLPLAIELAAARLSTMSLSQIVERLDERLGLLRSRGREARALDGALEWSWGLLKPWAKAVLSQASIFRGGFDLRAIEGVVSLGNDPNAPPFFDILGDLVDNSLIQKNQTDSGTVRYRLLESIRVYAGKKLHEPTAEDPWHPLSVEEARHRHAAHFAQMGTSANLEALDRYESKERWKSLFRDLDNLVVAIDYGTSETAPQCCLAALKVLGMKGPVSIGVDIATKVLEIPDLDRRVRLQLEIERSKCLRISGRMREAREIVRNSVVPTSELDDRDEPTDTSSEPNG